MEWVKVKTRELTEEEKKLVRQRGNLFEWDMEPPGLEEKILVTDGEYVWTDTWVDSHINIGFDTTGIFTMKICGGRL